MKKIYLIAGEASGDNIGAKLVSALKNLDSDIEFYGVAGPKMIEAGVKPVFPLQEISVMGFLELLPHIFKIIKKINITIKDILLVKPDMVITIDSPGFSLRVVKKIKNIFKTKLVHYVAPTVWAYKPERAKLFASIYDHLLTILPFEPKFFIKEGLKTDYIGYPAIEDLQVVDPQIFRNKYSITSNEILVCLTPGSREHEIKKMLPIFIESLEQLQFKLDKKLKVAVLTSINLKINILKLLKDSKLDFCLVDESEKQNLFSASELALSKSGTITTELAFYKIPMVVAHKINYISYLIIKKLLKIRFVSIINILADEEVIPEMVQENCKANLIADKLLQLVNEEKRFSYQEKIKTQLNKLKSPNIISASENAARIVLEILENSEQSEKISG